VWKYLKTKGLMFWYVQKSAQEYEKKELEHCGERPFGFVRDELVPEWELLVHTRQFSYEWQMQDLRDTENERVRKCLKIKAEKMEFR